MNLRLHPAAGRIIGIVETLLDRDSLERRQLLENLVPVLLGEILDDVDGIVRIEVADAFRNRLVRQFVENLLADRIVDLGQRREVEVDAHQRDELRTVLGLQMLDQRADVGFMEIGAERTHALRILALHRLRDPFDEGEIDLALRVAERQACVSRSLSARPSIVSDMIASGPEDGRLRGERSRSVRIRRRAATIGRFRSPGKPQKRD